MTRYEHLISRLEHGRIDFLTTENGVKIFIKRDDLIDANISGNKLFKLKENFAFAKKSRSETVITFGGAFSNHIAATATLGQISGIKTLGIIRGEKPAELNSTLKHAMSHGMNLKFISRAEYRLKNEPEFSLGLKAEYPHSLVIPEGGANALGVLGSKDMLSKSTDAFDHIITAMGTGTTFAGLVKAAHSKQKITGLPIHKHDKLLDDILSFDPSFESFHTKNFEIIGGYHFGGYAKWKPELITFIQKIYREYDLKLDPVYTGKALFGVFDLIEKGYFEQDSKILFIHTGGIQGVAGFEKRFGLNLFLA
jgi:1-aminocyclopropane-1-carboxylate deaminase